MSAQERAAASDGCVVNGVHLPLCGSGIRRVFMFDVYKVYLYADKRPSDESDLLSLKHRIRLLFEYLYGPISKDRILGAWREALLRMNTKEEVDAHREDLDAFFGTFGDVNKGDIVCYDIAPDHTVSVYTNQRESAVLASEFVAKAITKILFGSNPIDRKLKAALLAADPATS